MTDYTSTVEYTLNVSYTTVLVSRRQPLFLIRKRGWRRETTEGRGLAAVRGWLTRLGVEVHGDTLLMVGQIIVSYPEVGLGTRLSRSVCGQI